MGDPGGGASAPVDAPRVKRRKIQGDDGTGGGETVVLRPASKASSGIPASTATVRDGEARRKSTEESHDVPTDGETADKFEKMATEDSEKQLDASRTQEYASTGIEPGPQSNDDAMSGDIDKAEPPASKPASRPRKRTQRPPKPPPRPRSPPPPDFRPALRLTGHTGPVAQVRLSPDGRFIASASADGTARLWDSRTGEHIETLVGHLAGVSALAWSPDSATLATGSDDKTIRLWDRVTGRPRGARIRIGALRAGGPTDAAAAEEDEDGGTTGGNDEGGDEWMGPGPPPTGLVVGADGGAEDGGGDAVGGTGIAAAGAYQGAVLRGHHNYVYCVAFSPKGNILASGSYDEAVFLWDVRAGRLMRSLPAHSDPVSGIDFSADGTLVVSCSTDGLT